MAFLPQLVGDELEWLSRIACKDMDPNSFFVATGHSIADDDLEVCRTCPVRVECVTRAYTLGIRPGYFGGLSPSWRERHSLEEALELIAEGGTGQE